MMNTKDLTEENEFKIACNQKYLEERGTNIQILYAEIHLKISYLLQFIGNTKRFTALQRNCVNVYGCNTQFIQHINLCTIPKKSAVCVESVYARGFHHVLKYTQYICSIKMHVYVMYTI